MARTPLTQQYIRDVLHQHHTLTAPDILATLEQEGHEVNKTTVYRALEKLVANEEVCCHFFGGNTVHYELSNHHHDHLVCECCGDIEPVEGHASLPESLHGFQPRHQHLTVFGRCHDCPSQPHTHSHE